MARKGVFGDALRGGLAARPAKDTSGAESEKQGRSAGSRDPAGQDDAKSEGRRTAPNVRYFDRSFRDNMQNLVQEIDPGKVVSSALQDRFDVMEGLDELKTSIGTSGQKVPILVRRHADDGTFEIVYGRRRLAACRALGINIKAIVREMSDEEALLAQGLENAARLDASFIERCCFMRQMQEAGLKAPLMAQTYNLDDSMVTRMIAVARDIPEEVVRAIGAAHGAGRPKWERLRAHFNKQTPPTPEDVLELIDNSLPSPKRLDAVLAALDAADRRPGNPPAERVVVKGRLSARKTSNSVNLKLANDTDAEFLDYLETRLPDLFESWSKSVDRYTSDAGDRNDKDNASC